MSFRPRGMYTRDEIHEKLGGGSKQSYLPNRNGVVLCACLRADTNPGAPSIILTGNGPEIMRSAEMICSQKGAVPVFIKCGSGSWEYAGDYAVDRWSESPAEIAECSRRAGRTDVTRVIHMKRV